ncbi:hypothetical protein H9Y04_26545 [Streptomyces sp. TRM66268-LWL]|uniref:Uncharacterized protein n=1 Tax=Streptomyces polyasparticus TaxID=2767826 RepID=A0ABR7SKV6_9ACTN|nr:hypothetical protein [Streptomyces polyasparticus]MBC9716105.1 hypothetical protein [Streptomyces polyasparticus]
MRRYAGCYGDRCSAAEILVRDNGCLVITEPGVFTLPLLPYLMSELQALRRELPARVSLRVMFWRNIRPATRD